jgi:acyl-coenzyme A thioesterase PaaI-like protein
MPSDHPNPPPPARALPNPQSNGGTLSTFGAEDMRLVHFSVPHSAGDPLELAGWPAASVVPPAAASDAAAGWSGTAAASAGSRSLVTVATFGPACEGPTGCVHGGALATAIDACFGVTASRVARIPSVTLNLSVDYVRFAPLARQMAEFLIVSRVDNVADGRKIHMSAELWGGLTARKAVLHSRGRALFYRTPQSRL